MAGLDQSDRVVTCTIVRGEVLFGETGHQFLNVMVCEPARERAGDYYAGVKPARQQRGLAMDENDLWVAATALALDATLVSRDSDFAGIDGLSVIGLE